MQSAIAFSRVAAPSAPRASKCSATQRHGAFRATNGMNVRMTRSRQLVVRAEEVAAPAAASPAAEEGDFVPVLRPEELPKGVRKEVRVNGQSILLFWYRNEIYAIEARSPAEGAYSEGFIKAKFTQDYGIECPTTSSVFSLKTGEILEWYPTNPVLAALTPRDTCRPLSIFPVRLKQDALYVDVSSIRSLNATRGGADTSIDANNVYGLEPKVYLQGGEEAAGDSDGVAKTASVVVGAVAVIALGIAGTASLYYFLLAGPAGN